MVQMGRSDVKKLNPEYIDYDDNFNCRYFPPTEDEIRALADNILQNGQHTPIRVYKVKDRYKLIQGFTRLKAILLINKDRDEVYPIAAISVSPGKEEGWDIVENITENIWHKGLSVVDQAYAHQKLRDIGFSGKEIAKCCNCTESWVSQIKNLLDLPKEELEALHNGTISATKAANKNKSKSTKPSIKVIKDALEDYAHVDLVAIIASYIAGDITHDEFYQQMDESVDAYEEWRSRYNEQR